MVQSAHPKPQIWPSIKARYPGVEVAQLLTFKLFTSMKVSTMDYLSHYFLTTVF